MCPKWYNKKNPADRWQLSSFLKVVFISRVSALLKFIEHLPTASDFGVMCSKNKMDGIEIIKVEVLATKELLVTPATNKNDIFQFIYRAATGVSWNEKQQCFMSPIPKEWSHFDWYTNIVDSVISEMGVRLKITPNTAWHNITNDLQNDISNYESEQST